MSCGACHEATREIPSSGKMPSSNTDVAPYTRTEQRIARLTLVLGLLASVGAYFLFSISVAAGVMIGAVLAWINFRWLESALNTVKRAATAQAESAKARVPLGSVFGLIGRYLLIGAVVYAIFI